MRLEQWIKSLMSVKLHQRCYSDVHCPVEAYNVYASKRPVGTVNSDSLFYVACRTVQLHDPEKEIRFLNQRVG